MSKLPINKVTVKDGKREFTFMSEGVGVNVFVTILIILGIFCVAIIAALIFVWQSPYVAIPILLIVCTYGLAVYLIVNLLNKMAYNSKTQHLFFPPSQILPAHKWMNPQLSDDKHEPKEITDRTKFTQPQFEEGYIVEESKE